MSKLSSYSTTGSFAANDIIPILQKQSDNSYKNFNISASTVGSGIKLLGKLIGANMNTTSDQLITLSGGNKFIVTNIVMTNASISLTTASGGQWWDNINRSGNEIGYNVGSSPGNFALSILVSSTNTVTSNNATNHINLNGNNQVGNSIYFSLTTPQGSTATADIYIYGFVIS